MSMPQQRIKMMTIITSTYICNSVAGKISDDLVNASQQPVRETDSEAAHASSESYDFQSY